MEIEFDDRVLALLETDQAAVTGLPASVIQTARYRLTLLRAAPNFAMLVNWKSFGASTESGDAGGEQTVRLLDEWHMSLWVEASAAVPKAIIKKISQQMQGAA